MTRCYVCNAIPQDPCRAVDGEIAECPRPSPVDPRARRLIKTDGSEVLLDKPIAFREIEKLIGASCMDTVQLCHLGRPPIVMLLDDAGHEKRLAVNEKATALYHANCNPGTAHSIRGDVVIVPDNDFGGPL